MRSLALACVLLFAACSRTGDAEPDPQTPAEPAVGATTTTGDAGPVMAPSAATDCLAPMRGLFAAVARMENAAEGWQQYDKVVSTWGGVPDACRGPEWHLLAARILRFRADPLTAGSVTLATAEQALTAALALPDHPDVLVMVAFVSSLGGKPALPADACARARRLAANDTRTTYVCAHAGDRAQWLALASPAQFPDALLHQAEALAAAGKKKEARAAAERAVALDPTSARSFGATSAEHAELVKRATALLDGL